MNQLSMSFRSKILILSEKQNLLLYRNSVFSTICIDSKKPSVIPGTIYIIENVFQFITKFAQNEQNKNFRIV